MTPLFSIVIPTRDRPHLLPRAIESALSQTLEDLEVIVVDDASLMPVDLPTHPKLRVIRLSQPHGGAGARNIGMEAAQGRWIAYLDDDDCLLPHMATASLEALKAASLSPPTAIVSGIEVVNGEGKVTETRLPPPVRPKGKHFSLEPLESGCSYNTKQTMVVERHLLKQIGGWDETFRSRVHSELFLRLNPVCSIVGLPLVTYQLHSHSEARVSRDPLLRQVSFQRLVNKHRNLFTAHPQMFANFVYEHACTSYRLGQKRAAIANWWWALQIDPIQTLSRVTPRFKD